MEIQLLIAITYRVEVDANVYTHIYKYLNILFSSLHKIVPVINHITGEE